MPTAVLISITDEEKQRCHEFSTKIITSENQYNRFSQSTDVQILRTYIGKLAEYVFLHYLHRQGIPYPEGDMFSIFSGQTNVDDFDFATRQQETVDIKTASRSFHRRIMIPLDQYKAMPKDYYVGIKLNFIEERGMIKPFNIENCALYGYTTRVLLDSNNVENYGEGNCKAIELSNLHDINTLIERL